MLDFDVLLRAEGWISLISLTALEIVLGIDNIIFLSILSGKLPEAEQPRVRRLGMILALGLRLGLLLAISVIMRLTAPLFTLFEHDFSGRDLILIGGGLFLVGKSVHEIHTKLEGQKLEAQRQATGEAPATQRSGPSFIGILIQILLLDIVFSLDSVITAVGMAPSLVVMMLAMVTAVGVMLMFAGPVGAFVERHPTMKILALSFLLLVGVMLIAEGMGQHVSKGYIYFAMAFALVVEFINLRLRPHSPMAAHSPAAQVAPKPE
jgi:predicted tellurium resistance membrane protein TerC